MKNIKSKNVENDVLLDDEPIIENKNIKEQLNKKKVLSIIIVIALLLLVIGVTYAIYNNNFFSKEYSIKTGTVSIEFLETNDFISIQNALPMGDVEGKKQTDAYDFNIITEAAGDLSLTYNLYLEKLEVDTGYTPLEDDEVKFYLTDETNKEIVGPTKISELEDPFFSKTNIHSKTNTRIVDTFKIRVWVDKDVYPTGWEENPHQYKFKIGAKAGTPKNLDTSEANVPILSENMIAVYYDESCDNNTGCWRKADKTNTNKKYKWYNYDEKMWANSVTVTESNRATYKSANPGTKISMDDILTMQVWIPRYKYKVWNYEASSNPQEIQITFEKGKSTTGEITCTDNAQGTSDGTPSGSFANNSEICKINNTNCTKNTCNNKTYTHPAFTFGDKELEGIWVGKFEVSSDINCTGGSSVTLNSGCNLTNIRPLIKPNVTAWRRAIVSVFENNMMAMNDNGNKYGFAISDDTHMIKNMEWGAVAYLSHSKYGINKEVGLNSNDVFLTGCGPIADGNSNSTSICNEYNTILGQLSSTTGNIYGIYDMSGGAPEYVMGNMVAPTGKVMVSGNDTSDYSGYNGILYNKENYQSYTGYFPYPDYKYIDKYSFYSRSTEYRIAKLGDAIKETSGSSTYGWYNDWQGTLVSGYSWFARGGAAAERKDAGIFCAQATKGGVRNSYGNTSRLVISQ